MVKGLSPEEFKTVQKILKSILPQGSSVKIFGSRFFGSHRPYSDLDLAIILKPETLGSAPRLIDQLSESFAQSDLTFLVDLQNYEKLSDEFKKIVDADNFEFIA